MRLFWDGPRNFEPRLDDEDDTDLAPPLQTSALHQREDIWPPTYDLKCNNPNTWRIFSGIGFRSWNPPDPKSIPYH
ncbi:hypothetical protein AVEN_55899-1 [Araneus ventricosus]|uniref:Uncharacterized protein n=1 Tax=Araneus ventricosus TaxID=182803 RepID=A0A4Y2WKV3_ARAVE|nr:hypothetical protein AVEN_55899-1 [Araneus ventricosus]